MARQLLFCVETKKECNSDWLYINSVINYFYEYDLSEIRIRPLYMDGKDNYCKPGFVKKVSDAISCFKKSLRGETTVIYCFDCDDYDISTDAREALKREEQYCVDNGYKFVWFCKDIERVFIGEKVSDSEKGRVAERFARKRQIEQIHIEKISSDSYRNRATNLFTVLDGLDDHLKRKNTGKKK